MDTIPSTPGGTVSAGISVGPSGEVVGPDQAHKIGGVELGELFEEVQRVEQYPHHVVERVEIMDADESGGLLCVVVEVLVPRPVVDGDEVARFPRVARAVDLAVPSAGDHVQPGLAAVAVARLL